jgi:hypothetical protein
MSLERKLKDVEDKREKINQIENKYKKGTYHSRKDTSTNLRNMS